MGSMRGGLSKDPAKRERQIGNLIPNAHSTHGVYDVRRTAPLAEAHTIELRKTFPLADDRLIGSQAQRAAMIDLAFAWLTEHGLVRTAKGDPFPIAHLWRSLLNDSDQAHRALEQQQREREGVNPSKALELAEAKYLPQGDAEDADADVENKGAA
jgi:hypothetical protein